MASDRSPVISPVPVSVPYHEIAPDGEVVIVSVDERWGPKSMYDNEPHFPGAGEDYDPFANFDQDLTNPMTTLYAHLNDFFNLGLQTNELESTEPGSRSDEEEHPDNMWSIFSPIAQFQGSMISPNAQVQDGENDNNNTTSGGSNSSKGHVNVSATASTSEQVSGYSRPPLRIENGRFRVSAQRLMLASPYFESSLSNSWAEGTTLRARGHLDMVIYDFNPEAILYFLLIIHGLEARIPRMIPLQLLTDFAVLVDYFQAHDAVHIQMGLWISLLAPTIPIILCDDHVKWLCIAWTGRCNETFNHVARLIQRQSKIRIDALVLPIPDVILDSINQTRQNCLRYIIRELWTLIGEFLNGHKGCSFECQALYAGMLMRKLQAEGLFLPLPCRSFDGYSVENVMRFVSSVFFLHIGRRHCPSRAHCNFQDFVRPILDHAEKYASRVKGLGHYLNSAATVSQK